MTHLSRPFNTHPENIPMHEPQFTRRQILTAAGTAALGAPLLNSAESAPAKPNPARKRTLRLAHFTDVHVQPERGAALGMAAALKHVQSLDDPPSLIVAGGDAVMDSLAADADRTRLQWKLWQRTLKADCSLPVEPVIGNHDVWGWDKTRSRTDGKEMQWGKQRALDEFGLKERYRSFDRGGWHVIILDSIFPDAETVYRGQLDEKQFAWLAAELKKTPATTPVVVVSHIPILTVAGVEFDEIIAKKPQARRMLSHQDARRLVHLFTKHRKVKLCLSGHLHLTERCDYAGVTYLCSGAVSGNWWKGRHYETAEGYNVVDLYDDGTFGWRYVAYGWTARK
jgi:3',5'-cyclic-AMP phosphodiesterase